MTNIVIGTILWDKRSGNYFRVDSELQELQKAYWCTEVELDEDGNIDRELDSSMISEYDIKKMME